MFRSWWVNYALTTNCRITVYKLLTELQASKKALSSFCLHIPRPPHLGYHSLTTSIRLSAGGLFFLSFYTFKPAILIEPVFQSAKFGFFGWNRADAINRLCEEICKLALDLWNKIQLHFPFWIKFATPFNPRKKLRLLSECHLTNSCRKSRSSYTVCFKWLAGSFRLTVSRYARRKLAPWPGQERFSKRGYTQLKSSLQIQILSDRLCLPSLLGDGDKGTEIACDEKNKYFVVIRGHPSL